MPDVKIKRALIAVYDKTGIADFAKALVEEFGIEIISTGGTAKHLKDAGIPVTMVEEVTGFPEMLDGRVKTLHPKIHAGILADRDNPDHMRQLAEHDIKPIDMVIVNLYPFEETVEKPDCKFEEAIEMIDIGGPCLLRAAAKNHKHVVVASDTDMRDDLLDQLRREKDVNAAIRMALAGIVYRTTEEYDSNVTLYLMDEIAEFVEREGSTLSGIGMCSEGENAEDWFAWNEDEDILALDSRAELRYGENPHQKAKLYNLCMAPHTEDLTAGCDVGQSTTQMSHNNYLDANAALGLSSELARSVIDFPGLWQRSTTGNKAEGHVACFIKHTNACGVGVSGDPIEAYRRAYVGDPNAAMGGILAVNFNVDTAFADAVMNSLSKWGKDAGAGAFFVEVWLAPGFNDAAVELIRTKKKWGERVRLLQTASLTTPPSEFDLDFKRIAGGFLAQGCDTLGLNEDQWKVVTDRQPTDAEMTDLRLAWLICKHTKSNAITVCKDGMLIGNGAGQMSRIMSCRIATWMADENGHAEKLKGAAAASDAFFPFRDGPDILADAGVTAIIQPGGSKRDADTIAACNERGLAMIFTGTRHFKH